MEIGRKKIVILPLENVTDTATGKEQPEDVTDFRIRKDVIDRLKALKSVSRVIITSEKDDKEFLPMMKAVEFFVFVYCNTAVMVTSSLDELAETLPHSLKRKELMLSVGDKAAAEYFNTDYITLEDFLNL